MEAAKPGERFEITSIKAVRPHLAATVAALQQRDVARAKAAFEAYDSAWNGVEFYVVTRSRDMYQGLEHVLQARIDKAKKNWKLSTADIHERKFWPQYEDAYTRILSATSHKRAPWFVIPADNKWYRNVAISTILVDAMKDLKLTYPDATVDPADIKL